MLVDAVSVGGAVFRNMKVGSGGWRDYGGHFPPTLSIFTHGSEEDLAISLSLTPGEGVAHRSEPWVLDIGGPTPTAHRPSGPSSAPYVKVISHADLFTLSS